MSNLTAVNLGQQSQGVKLPVRHPAQNLQTRTVGLNLPTQAPLAQPAANVVARTLTDCQNAVNQVMLEQCSAASVVAANNACLISVGSSMGDRLQASVLLAQMNVQCEVNWGLPTRKPEGLHPGIVDLSTPAEGMVTPHQGRRPGATASTVAPTAPTQPPTQAPTHTSTKTSVPTSTTGRTEDTTVSTQKQSPVTNPTPGEDPHSSAQPSASKAESSTPSLGYMAWVAAGVTATAALSGFATKELINYFPTIKARVEKYMEVSTASAITGGLAGGAVAIAATSIPASFLVAGAAISKSVDSLSAKFGIDPNSHKATLAKDMVSGLITAGVLTGVTVTALPEVLSMLAVTSLVSIGTGVSLRAAFEKVETSLHHSRSGSVAPAPVGTDGQGHVAIEMNNMVSPDHIVVSMA